MLAQERQQAAAAAAAANPSTSQQTQQPADPSSFLRNLPASLRRTVLADMDDSVLQHLPQEYVSEARTLRQEHTRQIYEERSAALLEHVINSGSWAASEAGLIPPHRHFLGFDPLRAGSWRPRANIGASSSSTLQTTRKGETAKQMLDQEGLACLLLLFFVDQNKLHISRLHRVIKNLCQHPQTRAWMLASILVILEESCCSSSSEAQIPADVHVVTGALTPGSNSSSSNFSWLNWNISAALGCHAPVLQLKKTSTTPSVSIHPYASSVLSNSMLELLIFLARLFPASFLPEQLMPGEHSEIGKTVVSNFWQLLLKLDSLNSKKGKGSSKAFVLKEDSVEQKESELFSSSTVGQLIKMFNHPVIYESTSLTDKLFRLLALVTASIPKSGFVRKRKRHITYNVCKKETADAADEEPTVTADKQEESDVVVVSKVPYSEECEPAEVFESSGSQSSVEQQLLRDTIHTLIVGKCSEDGLEDATQFLIQLSRADSHTREIVLHLLLDGVRQIGERVCQQISTLLQQLEENKPALSSSRRQSTCMEEDVTSLATATAMVGRSTTANHSNDIHLPAMVPLSCKNSQQSFFLRLLKVVCQLRESALTAANANKCKELV